MNDFKRYFLDHGEPVSENPSPGNIAGGITTLEEKSLGAVQKAGRAPVDRRAAAMASACGGAGLTLLEAPGNDAVSSTALAAAGATIDPVHHRPRHAARLPGADDQDRLEQRARRAQAGLDRLRRRPGARRRLRAGRPTALLDADRADRLGRETAAERNGEREIAIWKRGVTL